jgi:hypothetical protein
MMFAITFVMDYCKKIHSSKIRAVELAAASMEKLIKEPRIKTEQFVRSVDI